jgi:putative transposase
MKETLKKLRRKQKKLSRKRKGSNNRNKQRIRVANLHEKVVNQRDDFLHKLSGYYADNYDLIAVEDLNVKGMVRNHRLAGSISDVAWNRFAQLLSYKAENAGKIVVKVDPKGTSREYNHGEIDRDYNAALNILQRGMEKVGQGLPEGTPVEIELLRELKTVSASSVVEAGSSLR